MCYSRRVNLLFSQWETTETKFKRCILFADDSCKGYVAVDIHSHTISSHDNVAPAGVSLKAHLSQVFDAFSNMEHNQTRDFAMFPRGTFYKTVYSGMQIQTEEGVSVITLSDWRIRGARL